VGRAQQAERLKGVFMVIRKLRTDEEILEAFEAMAELRPELVRGEFVGRVREQAGHGFELAAGFVEGRIVVATGYRVTASLAWGRHLFVDDLVTLASEQGKGYGTEMIEWFKIEGRAAGVERVYLDSRASAVGFYEKVGFTMNTSVPCWVAANT